MRTSKCLLLILVVVVGSAGSSAEIGTKEKGIVVKGNNEFALELYGKLREREGNLFFSPYSISAALGMTYGGARGQTEEQMAEVLGFPTTVEHIRREPNKEPNETEIKLCRAEFHSTFGEIIRKLNLPVFLLIG